MTLIDLIEKAAALAGKLGKKDLQEKLLQLAREAESYEDQPVQKPKMSAKDTRAAIWEGLREASLDPSKRKDNEVQIGMN